MPHLRPLVALACLALPTALGCGDDGGSATNERDAGGSGKDGSGGAAGSGSWADGSSGGPMDAASDATGDSSGGGTGGASADASDGSGGGTGGSMPTCPTIQVTSAIYAANCGAPTSVPSVSAQCDGKATCTYTMDYLVDPGFDPAFGCGKDMTVGYDCVTGSSVVATKSAYAPPEAGVGGVLSLECACSM